MNEEFEKWYADQFKDEHVAHIQITAHDLLCAFVRTIKDRQALRAHHDLRMAFNEVVQEFGLEL